MARNRSRTGGRLIDFLQSAIRRVLAPMDTIAGLVPSNRNVYELGCGQGLLMEALASRAARVTGVDFDPRKCEMARERLARFSNVEVVEDEILSFCAGRRRSADVAILCDTLSSFSPDMQRQVLDAAAATLVPGGMLLVAFVDTEPRWKWFAAAFTSGIVYRVLSLSISQRQQIDYMPRQYYVRALDDLGFSVETRILHRERHRLIPHVVLVAREKGAGR